MKQPAKTTAKVTTFVLSSLSIALFSANIAAVQFNYDSVQVTYLQVELDAPGIEKTELNGIAISGSYSITSNLVVGLSYSFGQADTRGEFVQLGIQPIELEVSGPSVMAFYRSKFGIRSDYLIGAAYGELESTGTRNGSVDIPEVANNDATKSLFGGVRHHLNSRIEISLLASYDLDAEQDQDEYSFQGEASYVIQPLMDVAVQFSPADSGDTIGISLRKYF